MFSFSFAMALGAGASAPIPVLQSATVAADGLSIALQYDQTLTAVPAAGAYTLDGTHATVAAVSGVGTDTVTLTFPTNLAVTIWETVTVTSTDGPASDNGTAANLSAQAVTNGSQFLVGAVVVAGFRRANSHTKTGTTLLTVRNEVTGVSIAAVGTPVYGATAFNGGPGATLNGTACFLTTDSAIYNLLKDSSAHHVFASIAPASSDQSGFWFGVGNTASSTQGRRGLGQTTTLAGAHRDFYQPDVGSSGEVTGTDGGVSTSPQIIEAFGSTTTTFRINNAATGITNAAISPGTLTPNKAGLGAMTTGAASVNGFIGVVADWIAFASVLSGAEAAKVARYLGALTGVTVA